MSKNPKDKPGKKPGESVGDEQLASYLKFMEEESLQELEITEGEEQIKLVREARGVSFMMPAQAVAPNQPAAASGEQTVAEPEDGTSIKAPLGGVFYQSPSPKSPPFIREGDLVTIGQTLCIIEAMKVMNEIKAEVAGRVSRILVENGKSVDAQQSLFILKPS